MIYKGFLFVGTMSLLALMTSPAQATLQGGRTPSPDLQVARQGGRTPSPDLQVARQGGRTPSPDLS